MKTLANDSARHVTRNGLVFALISASSFGLSGPIARALLDTGWSAPAAVTIRIAIAALVLAPLAIGQMTGRIRELVRPKTLGAMAAYGAVAVASPQLCYFYAVETLQVGVALLIEYLAPVVVVGWMWLRHGQRPTWRTLVGAAVAAAGLALVLQLFGGIRLDAVGVAWALGATIGAAGYFIMSGTLRTPVPAVTLAGGGLFTAAIGLGALGAVGILPMSTSTADVTLGRLQFDWWAAVLTLGVITASVAYVTGIAAARRLGSRLASFVALAEVVAAIVFAWLLLGQVPAAVQLLGGALILAGVIVVKLGEPKGAPDEVGHAQIPGSPSNTPLAVDI
ncbi:EamA family transporter [Gordonia sp. CPCC 205333]